MPKTIYGQERLGRRPVRSLDASGRRRRVAVLLAALVLTGGLFMATGPESAAQGDCPEGSVLSSNGVSCELDIGQNNGSDAACPAGQQLDAAGLLCEAIPADDAQVCFDGKVLDDLGLFCVDPIVSIGNCPDGQQPNELGTGCILLDGTTVTTEVCDEGFSLGADGVTCVADGPQCDSDEVLDDNGACVRTFQCPDGMFLTSDLLGCISDRCPSGELRSVDGKRCVAPDSNCPDGSPRPVGGSCLVVETVEGDDGVEVIVRCDVSDSFCQAQVKECAEGRATGASGENGSCEDPRTSCDENDDACTEANERLVNCATRDDRGGESEASDQGRDPCDDLCPRLHRLDPSGECVEYLDPLHPCVSFGRVPAAVTTNQELDGYSYLAGTGQCVTRGEFLRRLGNFEAAAGAEADALAILRETTSEYLTVEEELLGLEAALVTAESDVRQFTADAADADVQRSQNERDLLEARKALQREVLLLREEVVQVYVSGGRDIALEAALLGADDPTELGLVQSYGEALLDDQIDNINRIRDLETATVELGVDLDRAAAEVKSSLDSAVVTTADIETMLVQAEKLRQDQLARRNEEAEMVSQLRADKGRFAQELGVFDQASREIADIISESEFLVTEFRDFDGLFANPVIPAIVASGFGPRLHPILGYVRNHNGLDLSANFGEPIYASAPGIVQIASTFGGYGETVVLDHGGGLLTLYAHQSVIGVDVGDEVQRGDVIGFIGSTGLSTGPHLHYEVWVDGRTAVDPLPYLTDLN